MRAPAACRSRPPWLKPKRPRPAAALARRKNSVRSAPSCAASTPATSSGRTSWWTAEPIRGRCSSRPAFFAADPHLAEPLDRFAGGEVLQLVHLPDLDLAVPERGVGHAPGPGERFLARLDLDQRVAGDQLLGLREWPIDDALFA